MTYGSKEHRPLAIQSKETSLNNYIFELHSTRLTFSLALAN